MRSIRAALLAAIFAPAVLAVAGSAAGAQNPFTSPEDIQVGRQLFELDCANCHGGDARGGRGPDLTRGTFRHATNDEQLFQVVRFGIPGTEMPRRVRTDPRAWRVVAYLRSLGGDGELPPGDPERGREIFFGSGTCSTCHVVDGQGTMQGPDLTAIGYQRSPDHLRTSLLEPDSELDPRWWGAQVETLDGAQASGYLLGNDLHTVRLLDIEGNLLSFPKASLARFEPEKTSRMPSFDGMLSPEDIDNMIAYLASLRGEATQ